MKPDYLKFVQWSEPDRLFVGYCPDLFIGGVCHGPDEQKVYRELSRLVAAEIGIEPRSILDREAHEAVIDGRRIPLTRLELSVLGFLHDNCNRAISRASLIENVWGYSYTSGSNVVDAVVGSLRKKLGEQASLIETVSGVGYRLRTPTT